MKQKLLSVLIKGLCHARLGDFSTDLMVISNIKLAAHIIAVNQPKRDTEKPRKVMYGKAQLEIILHYSKLKKVYHKDIFGIYLLKNQFYNRVIQCISI